jgi:hypothetical protein
MGACLSCLGLAHEDKNDSETQHLLYGADGQHTGYGSGIGDSYGLPGTGHSQGLDPDEVRREQEALNQIVVDASGQLIDIFASRSSAHGENGSSPLVRPRGSILRHSSRFDGHGGGHDDDHLDIDYEQNHFDGPSSHPKHHHSHLSEPYPSESPSSQVAEYHAITQRALALLAEQENNGSYDKVPEPKILPPSTVTKQEREWLAKLAREGELALSQMVEVKTKGVGSLVVGFEAIESEALQKR